VVIEGSMACGKTMTTSQQAASWVLLDIDQAARHVLAVEPALLLEGARPRLLDEWQLAPDLWNHVRRAVDGADQHRPVPAHRLCHAGGRCQPPHRRRSFRGSADAADEPGGNRCVERGRVAVRPVRRGAPSVLDLSLSLLESTSAPVRSASTAASLLLPLAGGPIRRWQRSGGWSMAGNGANSG
jgi:hypothetical protein